ncbi:MAG TPA: glucokinase [Acidobacteriaceae bacterium]|jgi:glucokinase
MILAGDVGGTKVHLALYSFVGGKLSPVRDAKFPATEFACLDDVVKEFLSPEKSGQPDVRGQILASCFGVPGPVRDGRLKLTNLPWTLDARDLQRSLGIQHIFLINDLEANGYGIPELAPEKIFTLHAGDASSVGHRGLIAAGTGLGECLLIWDSMLRRHLPIPSEGGHGDFAARNDIEIALLNYLRHSLNGRVSTERVVSGLGIRNVYAFLRDDQKMEEPDWLRERMQSEDPNAVIGSCAEDGSSEICVKAIEVFVSAYGAEAGNLALKLLALGGIYLGGGIAPKILKFLAGGTFTQAFLDKGRLSPLLETIPVRVILDDTCALLGAAAYAEARAAELSGHSERQASVHGS